MKSEMIVNGRVTGPRQVELDESVTQIGESVQVILKPTARHRSTTETVFEFLRNLPPGSRTKQDIDRQIREERDAWGDR